MNDASKPIPWMASLRRRTPEQRQAFLKATPPSWAEGFEAGYALALEDVRDSLGPLAQAQGVEVSPTLQVAP